MNTLAIVITLTGVTLLGTFRVRATPVTKAAQTSCQWLYANGYSYTAVLSIWAQENFPANWDADLDGYPCEQTYGNKELTIQTGLTSLLARVSPPSIDIRSPARLRR